MKKKNSRQQFTQKHTKNLRAELLALLDRSNMYLQPERRVPFATAVEVANRDLRKTRNSDPEARVFSALRAVSSFVSLSAKNKVTTSALSNADLLPVGHPMSRKRHAMTASALRHARAKWIAADELVDDSARELVIIAHAADPGSIERIHAFARLMALGPKFVPITAAIDVEPLNPITAAFGFGLGGNSKAARSARAKMQRRDKYGRFAEQGGGFMFNLRMPDGLFSSLSGRVVGASGDEDIEIEVKDHATVPDGIYAIPSSKGTVVKGILSKEALEDANLPEGKEKLDIVGNDDAIDFNDLVRQDAPTGWTRQAPEAEEVPKAGPIQVLRDAAGKKLVRLSDFQKRVFGPRKPGGKYRSGYSGEIYEVLEVRLDENGSPVIRVRGEDGFEREHSTAWDPKRDKIISEPEAKASSSSAQEVFTSEDGYFVKKDGDTLSLHRADLTDNSIGDEVTRGDSWADVVKGAKADQDDYEKVLEAADAADKTGAQAPEAAPAAGPAKRTKQRLESARKGGVDYGSMTDAEIAEMAKAESDEYYKAGVWRVVQPKIPKGGYKTSKGNWKEYDEPVGKPTEEMVVGPEADAIREQFTKERTETLSQLRDAVRSGEIENLPAVRDLTDGNAVQQAIAAKKAKQKFRFNYNGKDREITPSEAYNNPKTGKDNIVGLDENEQIRTFTSDKMSPPNKKSEQPVKKATLEEVAPEASELSDVKDFTKGAGDPRPEKERNEIEAAINAGQKLRVSYGGKDRVIEPLRIWTNPKTEQENVTAIDHSDGGKEKNFGLLKIEKPSASRDQAIEDAIGRIKDIADRSAKPSGKPIEELDGAPLRMGGPVDVNPNDPTISLQEQMQNAIDNGETVRFDYSGKERVFTPENIYKNPKNGNVNVRGTDDSGESKTFTLDKIEQAEAKPAEPFKRLSPLDKVRKAFDKLFSEPNDGEKRRKAMIELKDALDNAVAEGRLSEAARFRILEQLDKPTGTDTDYDAAAWSEFLDATKKKPKKRDKKFEFFPGGRSDLPEYDLNPYQDESKYYDDEGNLNDLGRKENERRAARRERIANAAKNPKNWKKKGMGYPATDFYYEYVGPDFGDENPRTPTPSDEAVRRSEEAKQEKEKAAQEQADRADDTFEMTNGEETIFVGRGGVVSAEEKGFRIVKPEDKEGGPTAPNNIPKGDGVSISFPLAEFEEDPEGFAEQVKRANDLGGFVEIDTTPTKEGVDTIVVTFDKPRLTPEEADAFLGDRNNDGAFDARFSNDNEELDELYDILVNGTPSAPTGGPTEPSRDSKIDELWEEFLENDDISELESFLDSAGADATEQNFNEYLEDNGIDGDVNNEDDEDRVRAARRNFFGELYSQDSDNLREKFAEYIENRDQELYDERIGEPPTGGPGEPPTGGPTAPTGGPSAPGGIADSDENLGKDDIEDLFDYLFRWDVIDGAIRKAVKSELSDVLEERQVSIDDIREAMRPLYDSGTFKPENLDKAFNEIAKEIRSRYDLSEPEIMEGTFEVLREPFGDEPATVKVTKNYDEPGDINIELFTIDGELFDGIYYEPGYSARALANDVRDSFGPDIESLIVDEEPEESKKWIADQTDKYVKNLAKQLLKDADGYPDEARNDVLEDLITVAADQNDLTPDELNKLRELIAEGQSAPTGGPEGLTEEDKKKILDSFLPKGPKTLEELERGPLRTGGTSDVVPDSVEDLVGDTPDEDAGLEDTAPDLLARRRGKNMTALPDKMPEDADKRTKKFYNPDGSLNESGIKENEKRAKKRAKYLKEVNDPQNWSLKSTKDSPEVEWRWVGGDRGVNGGIDDFTYPPNTAPDSVVEWYQERDRRLAEERKAKQEELEKNPPAPLRTGTDEPQGEDDFDSFVSQEFDSTYDVPDGAYKPNIFSYYEPKGRQEGNSARYTDDPTSLATELDQDELVVALAQAVLPMGNNEASGFGPVNFGDGDEQVPAEALYEALDAQGADAALILAKIYDSAMDPNRGETNVDRHRQRNDDEKKLDAIKAPEQPQLKKKLSPDEEARQRNKQASTPSNAQILLDEMADYEETNQGIIDIADELRKIQEIAETEEESLKRELNRQIFNFESIEGFVQKYIDLALSNNPEDQAAFAGLWGMLMSIDGGSSSPEEITGSSIRKAVYNAIEEKFGAGSRTNEVYDEFNAKYGGFIEFVNGKMDIINGDADLDSGSSAAGFLRLMKAASAPNEQELQRSFGVSHMNPELLEQYTTVGNIISIDPRPFSTWEYSKSLTTGYGSQWAPKSAKDNQVVLVAAPGELDSISAVGVSWFDMELEHLAHGQFEVVSVERIPQSMGRADAFVVQIKRADTSVEDMAAERAIAEAGEAPSAPAAAREAAAIDIPQREIKDVSGWKRVAEKTSGSNEGAFYEDENGQRYYVKVPKSQSHAENETLASVFYDAFEAPSAEVSIGDSNGDLRVVSKVIPGAKQDLRSHVREGDEEYLDQLREHFVIDAWLANWDVTGTGFDNVMSDENGRPVRVDPGGALMWRAQGEPKGGAFGSEVTELDTLRDPDRNGYAAAVFGNMTDDDLRAGAEKLRDMTPSKIDAIVDSVITDPDDAELIKERLKARRQNILDRFGLDEIDETSVFTEPVPLTESMGTPAQDLLPGDVTANDSFTIERVFTDESTPKGKVSVEGYYPGHETQRKEWNQETIIESVRGGETPPKGDKPALHRPKKPYAPTAPAISGALAQELQDAQSWAEIRDIIGDREIIFFDYETTGIGNGSNNVPVQLGAVKVRNGEVVDRFNLFMDPREPLSDWSKENLLDADGNPLTDEHLAQQMGLEEAHAQFADWMGESPILAAHNLPFDREVLERMNAQGNIDVAPAGYIDTLRMGRDLVKKKTKKNPEGTEGHKLGQLLDHYGIEIQNWHSADADAQSAGDLFNSMLNDAADRPDVDPASLNFTEQDRNYSDAKSAHDEAVKKYEEELAQYNMDKAVAAAWNCGGGGGGGIIAAAEENGNSSCNVPPLDEIIENSKVKPGELSDPESITSGNPKSDENPYDSGTGDDSADEVADKYPVDGESYPPTPQQQAVINTFLDNEGEDIVVRAAAGAGKTSTLLALAKRIQKYAPKKRIIYIAFNRSVADEAKGKMPANVEVRTADSISYNWTKQNFPDLMKKQGSKTALVYPKDVVAHLGIPEITTTNDDGKEVAMSPKARAAVVRKAIYNFTISDDVEIGAQHFENPDEVTPELLASAQRWWEDVTSANGKMPFNFNHMKKMWSLSNPDLNSTSSGLKEGADIIFVDEFQDTNDVLGSVVASQANTQNVYVGDQNQAIYQFMGANDWLDKVDTEHDLPLTQSFRFGSNIANVANKFLRFKEQYLGGKKTFRVEGAGKDAGTIVPRGSMEDADAVLVRSNAGAFKAVREELDRGRTVGVTKGFKKDLDDFIVGVEWLQGDPSSRGDRPARMPEELQQFANWQEVLNEAADPNSDLGRKAQILIKDVEDIGVSGLKDLSKRVKVINGAGDKKDFGGSPDLPDNLSTGTSGDLGREVTFEVRDDMIILDGNTFPVKDSIKGSKIAKWNGDLKKWVVPAKTDAERQSALKKMQSAINGETETGNVDVVVTTVHQAKGLEWPKVRIGDDFWGPREDKNNPGEYIYPSEPELNLAYVAVTRAEKELDQGALSWIDDFVTGDEAPEAPEEIAAPESVDAPEVDRSDEEPNISEAPVEIVEDSAEPAAPDTGIMYSNKGEAPTEAAKADDLSTVLGEVDAAAADILDEDSLVVKKPSKKKAVQAAYDEFKKLMSELKNGDITEAEAIDRLNEIIDSVPEGAGEEGDYLGAFADFMIDVRSILDGTYYQRPSGPNLPPLGSPRGYSKNGKFLTIGKVVRDKWGYKGIVDRYNKSEWINVYIKHTGSGKIYSKNTQLLTTIEEGDDDRDWAYVPGMNLGKLPENWREIATPGEIAQIEEAFATGNKVKAAETKAAKKEGVKLPTTPEAPQTAPETPQTAETSAPKTVNDIVSEINDASGGDKQVAADLLNQYAQSMGLTPEIVDLLKDFLGIKDDGPDGGGGGGGVTPSAPKPSGNGGGGVAPKYTEADAAQAANRVNENIRDSGNEDFADATSQSFLKKLSAEVKNAEPNDKTVTVKLDYEVDIDIEDAKALLSYYAGEPYSPKAKAPEGAPKAPDLDPEFAKVLNELDAAPEVTPVFSTEESDIKADDVKPEWQTMSAPKDPTQVADDFFNSYRDEEFGIDLDSTTDEDVRAAKGLLVYQNEMYSLINDRLRSGNAGDEVLDDENGSTYAKDFRKEIIKVTESMDELFDAAPTLTEDTMLYRGIHSEYSDELMRSYEVGDMFTDLGFSSTTISRGQAEDFTDYGEDSYDEDTEKPRLLLEIIAPADTRAIYLPAYLGSSVSHPDEDEVLLDRGTTFRVISKTESADGTTKVMRVAVVNQDRKIKPPEPVEEPKAEEPKKTKEVNPLTTDVSTLGMTPIVAWDEPKDDSNSPVFYDSPEAVLQLKEAVKRGHGFVAIYDDWQTEIKISAIFWDDDKQEYMLTTDISSERIPLSELEMIVTPDVGAADEMLNQPYTNASDHEDDVANTSRIIDQLLSDGEFEKAGELAGKLSTVTKERRAESEKKAKAHDKDGDFTEGASERKQSQLMLSTMSRMTRRYGFGAGTRIKGYFDRQADPEAAREAYKKGVFGGDPELDVTPTGAKKVEIADPKTYEESAFPGVQSLRGALSKLLDRSNNLPIGKQGKRKTTQKARVKAFEATAVDSGDIEDLQVRANIVRDKSGKKQIRLQFKLTAWAASDQVKKIRSGEEVWDISDRVDIVRPTIDDNGDLVYSDDYVLQHQSGSNSDWEQSRTFSRTLGDGQRQTKISLIRGYDTDAVDELDVSGKAPVMTFHNSVEIFLPLDATDEEIADALRAAGVSDPRPAEPEDVKILAENRLLSVFASSTNASVNETDPRIRQAQLQKIKEDWGLTPEDVELTTDSAGFLTYKIPDAVAEKIVEATDVSLLDHQFSWAAIVEYLDATIGYRTLPDDEQKRAIAEFLVAAITGDEGGLKASMHRFTEGAAVQGLSSQTDLMSGSGMYVYVSPKGKYAKERVYSSIDIHLYFDPRKAYRRVDFYANYSDDWGKRAPARDVIDAAKAGNYEVMFKHGLSINDAGYILVDSELRGHMLEALERQGITEIAGKPVEDFVTDYVDIDSLSDTKGKDYAKLVAKVLESGGYSPVSSDPNQAIDVLNGFVGSEALQKLPAGYSIVAVTKNGNFVTVDENGMYTTFDLRTNDIFGSSSGTTAYKLTSDDVKELADGLKKSVNVMEDASSYDGSIYAWPGEHGTSTFMPVGAFSSYFNSHEKYIKMVREAFEKQGAEQAAKMIFLKLLHNDNHNKQAFVDGITNILIDHPEILTALRILLRA